MWKKEKIEQKPLTKNLTKSPNRNEPSLCITTTNLKNKLLRNSQQFRVIVRGMDDVSASSRSLINGPPSRTPSSFSSTIFTNFPLFSALLAFAIAQFIKFFTSWYRERRWDFKKLVGSGGMPSSHSSTVSALAVAIGLQEGFGASIFAVALILACVVMYDATGVRLHAGRQAEVLNQIVYELPAEHPLAESRPLRELLGHTPPQVIAGGLLGIVTSSIGHLMIIMTRS